MTKLTTNKKNLKKKKKYDKPVNITKKKQIHKYREQTRSYQWGEGRGQSNVGQ